MQRLSILLHLYPSYYLHSISGDPESRTNSYGGIPAPALHNPWRLALQHLWLPAKVVSSAGSPHGSAEGEKEDCHPVAVLGLYGKQVLQEGGRQARNFDLLLASLLEKVLDQVMDVVDNVPADFPYDTWKDLLLENHTLPDQEKLEVLFKIELVGWLQAITAAGHHACLLPTCLRGYPVT